MMDARNQRLSRLDAIRAQAFAMWETGLYLDGHPDDKTALDYYKERRKEYMDLVMAYEKDYGPLTSMATHYDFADGWDWPKGPWPWQEVDPMADMKEERK